MTPNHTFMPYEGRLPEPNPERLKALAKHHATVLPQ